MHSGALRTLPHGWLNTFAWKAPSPTARLLALMNQDGRSSVICCSGDGTALFIAFDLLYLNGKDLRTAACKRCLFVKRHGSLELVGV